MAVTSCLFRPALAQEVVDFCADLYRDDPNWIPPVPAELARQFDAGFDFYQTEGNRHRHFIATTGKGMAGHVLAQVNHEMRDRQGHAVGALGFFECVPDYAAAEDLLGAATDWLRDEAGRARIWGPLDFDIWHRYRFLTRGFDETPFFGEPYNPPYYPDYFERFGFDLLQTWNSFELRGRAAVEAVAARSEARYRRVLAEGYRFVPVRAGREADVRALHRAEMRSYQGFLGYTTCARTEYQRIVEAFVHRTGPGVGAFVYDPAGAVAGFTAAYPDIGDSLRAARAAADPTRRRAVFYMFGISPEERAKRHGLGSAVAHHTFRRLLAAGYEEVVFALVAADSPARGIIGAAKRTAQKEYALYALDRS
ncbi:MAG: hypothetical protein QNJ94_22010 [Alphaproteobacteria bacterium]|nr:hypothetical protein [Alphaproteobacteria bacterium]